MIKSFFILFAMVGMICSCSGHRATEEKSLETEETALEDVISRGEESERRIRHAEQSQASRQTWQLSAKPVTHFLVRNSRLTTSSERDQLNGRGTFLII